MQDNFFDPSQKWPTLLYVVLAAALGWLGKSGYRWVLLWLQRKAPQASIKEALARAQKTEAEARQIEVQANNAAADSVMSMVERMVSAQNTIDNLRAEVSKRDVGIATKRHPNEKAARTTRRARD